MKEVWVEPYSSPLSAEAKGGPAEHTGISLLARSEPGIQSHVCWVIQREGQVKNCTLPTKMTSSYLKILHLSKMLLGTAQLHPDRFPVQAWKLCWTSKPDKNLTPNLANSQWLIETSPEQHGPQPQESVRKTPNILVHVPTLTAYKQKDASKDRQCQFLQWFWRRTKTCMNYL